ncbi:hypothetical protein ABB37_07907 [Leptomonas pyrrhocoris]|uniref:Uncharacterized protein n=1 Tax=Leptomonas pyrrhocoris TaxID=157538 RepID=A0A0M9FU49_LEPPY|nr:hypothetical protein ABB37_07907 [Leptomonas pyrrhocoris]KPA76140.1 hypothetical protein ABB37_07907 [Leptomonas pyrrhocoris]|eukprot:XP_015654579.1 hypothetical protein ABB37_07907 [Leptomonas pyrrhocoris]
MFKDGAPADAHTTASSFFSPFSLSSTPLACRDSKSTAVVLSDRDREGDEALTPTAFSNSTTSVTTSIAMHTEDEEGRAHNSDVTLRSTDAPTDSALPQPQPRARRWTPRRRSPGNCSFSSIGGSGEAGVTTVRDWVRSSRCSPSKEPRSSSVSRRDGFVASFVSALVPREGSGGGSEGGGHGEGFWGESGTSITTRSDSLVGSARGEREEAVNLADGGPQPHLHRMRSPPRTASWRQLRSHPGGASSRVPPLSFPSSAAAPPPSSSFSSLSSAQSLSLPGTPTFSTAALSRDTSWTGTNLSANWEMRRAVLDREHTDVVDMCGSVSTAVTLMRGWGMSEPHGQHVSSTLSGVSSPSVLTPLSSRAASPAAFAPSSSINHHHSNREVRTSPPPPLLASSSSVPSSGPAMSMSARELAQMREWQSTAEAQQQEQPLNNMRDSSSGGNALFGASARLPPTVPRATRQDDFNGRCWSGGEPLSARSDSPSRASASSYASGMWSGQRGSNAQTSLGWRSDAAGGDSTTSSRRLSPVSFSHAWSGGVRRGSGFPDSCTTTPLTPASPGFPHPLSADLFAVGQGYFNAEDAVDARTMEDIEDANTKRQCVESPTAATSPMLTSLSLSLGSSCSSLASLSLADALATQSSRVALPSEAHLWQQRERRRRDVSPSVARPDDDDCDNEEVGRQGAVRGVADSSSSSSGNSNTVRGDHCCVGAEGCVTGVRSAGRRDAEAAALGGGGGSSSPCTSAARTAASSCAGLHSLSCHWQQQQQQRKGNDSCGVYDHDSSPPLALLREATVAPSAAARTGVFEVGTAEDEAGDGEISSKAASLSFCSASEDEPEVDTFALERAQAVMEDADAEAVATLLARQHLLHVHATSDFAQDLRAHGAHVDPALWEEKVVELKEGGGGTSNIKEEEKPLRSSHKSVGASNAEEDASGGTGLSVTSDSLDVATGSTTKCSPLSPPPLPPSAAHAPSSSSSYLGDSPARCASSTLTSRIGGDEGLLRTPPRPKRPAQHMRWGAAEDSEEVRTPGSATTASSRSLRDVSPPVRERSMAPAELWKEKEEKEEEEL